MGYMSAFGGTVPVGIDQLMRLDTQRPANFSSSELIIIINYFRTLCFVMSFKEVIFRMTRSL